MEDLMRSIAVVITLQLLSWGIFQVQLSHSKHKVGDRVEYSEWVNPARVVKVDFVTDDFAIVRAAKSLLGGKEEMFQKAYLIQSTWDQEVKWASENSIR